MANVVRLILLGFAFVASTVMAVVKPTTSVEYSVSNSGWHSTAGAACNKHFSQFKTTNPDQPGIVTSTYVGVVGNQCVFKINNIPGGWSSENKSGIATRQGAPTCPANSTLAGAQCQCSAGYKEINGECKKDDVCGFLEGKPVPGLPRIEADYGPQSASWAAGKVGGKGLVCTPEQCQASGTVTGCVAGQGAQGTTVCFVSDPKYTGDSCKKDDKPGDNKPESCPPGTKKSATNPALCEPLDTKCPEGSEPSKYAEGVCIPVEPGTGPKECEDPNDPTKKIPCEGKPNECPKGYVPSQYVKGVCIPAEDGEGTDKNGDKVTCKDGVCTITKPGGAPPVTKPKGEFCADNPENDLCTKKSDATFSGTCEMSFTCKGDVLQCAIAQEQHKRNCQFFVTPTPESGVFENARAQPQEDVLAMTAQTVDLATHINSDSIITGSCPADMVIPVASQEIRFPLSQFCQYFDYLGLIVMLMTAVTCLRILGKD